MIRSLYIYMSAVLCLEFITNTKFNISCVSLEREAKRRTHMNKILSFANCNYKIFDAVDGNLVINNQKKIKDYSGNSQAQKLLNNHLNLEPKYNGTTGLKLSHYIIMRELETSKSTLPLLILEDDADIEADFVSTIENTLVNLKEDWDIILLTPRFVSDYTRPHNNTTELRGMLFFYGTYGFLVNGHKSAKKIADFIEECPLRLPIDDHYGNLSKSSKLIGFAYSKQLVTHLGDVFASTIATSYPLNPANLNNSLYKMSAASLV